LRASGWSTDDQKAVHDQIKLDATKLRKDINITGKDVVIAIIDTGCDIDHPEFKRLDGSDGHRILLRRNFDHRNHVNDVDVSNDIDGHGTHVAAIAAGLNGVAPGASLMIARVADDSDLKVALDWCVLEGASIINISIGFPREPDFDYFGGYCNQIVLNNDVVIVVSQGNLRENEVAGTSKELSPAWANECITVGCISSDNPNAISSISYRGDVSFSTAKPDLVAPGVDILSARSRTQDRSTDGKLYTRMSGTSMSTAFVSGACALLLQVYRHFGNVPTPSHFKRILTSTASKPPRLHNIYADGHGRLNIRDAIESLTLRSPNIEIKTAKSSTTIATTVSNQEEVKTESSELASKPPTPTKQIWTCTQCQVPNNITRQICMNCFGSRDSNTTTTINTSPAISPSIVTATTSSSKDDSKATTSSSIRQ
jgi:subtilisin family serine protease